MYVRAGVIECVTIIKNKTKSMTLLFIIIYVLVIITYGSRTILANLLVNFELSNGNDKSSSLGIKKMFPCIFKSND